MGARTSSLAAEIDAVREFYAALNRNDVPAMLPMLDPAIEWIEPDHYPRGGTHHGIAKVEELMTTALATWAEGSCEPEQYIPVGDKVVVYVYVHVRLKDRTDWIDARLADVLTFRDGKAVEWRHFPDRGQALAWAEAEAAEAAELA